MVKHVTRCCSRHHSSLVGAIHSPAAVLCDSFTCCGVATEPTDLQRLGTVGQRREMLLGGKASEKTL